MSSSNSSNNRLNVFLRIKPTSSENSENQVFHVSDETRLKVQSNNRGTEIFKFSKIFGQNSSQAEIFEETVKNSVESFLNGQDCLVFAYGTTNAGKTYSVQGTQMEPGLIPRAMQQIFQSVGCAVDDNPRIAPINFNQAQIRNSNDRQLIDKAKANIIFTPPQHMAPASEKFSISFMPTLSSTICEPPSVGFSPSSLPVAFQQNSRCSIWISMLEVYNEVVYDLLTPIKQSTKSSVKILSDGLGNFCPQDNIEIHVSSLEEANKILQYGQKQRTTMATLLNINSSRSHCILRVRLLRVDRSTPASKEQALSPAADVEDVNVSTFMFIDLAGSERVDKAGTLTNISRARETGNINSSLLVLGRCMEMLKLKGESSHSTKSMMVPYRDSKLTKILQPLLCTPGPKSLLVNINTSPNLFEETHNVLKFSCVARVVEFREPQKPLPVTKKLQPNTSTETSPSALSDTDTSDEPLKMTLEQLEEEKRLRDEVETKLSAALKENKNLRESIDTLKSEHAQSERSLRRELTNGFNLLEQEMQELHQKALDRKENQLITLMEKRLDVQQEFYQGELATEKAKLQCSKEYCSVLEKAINEWEAFKKMVVPKEELVNLNAKLSMKEEENERLIKIMQKKDEDIMVLKMTTDDLRKQLTEASLVAESGLQEEINSLQQEIKTLLDRIKTLTNTLDEKDSKISTLKHDLKSLTVTANKLQNDCNRFKNLTNFIVNQYHPAARDSLVSHSEEETWSFIQREFNLMPMKCKELEMENSKLNRDLELAKEDFKKLEERRNAQLASYEDELRIKSIQLETEKREVQALQKQLLGMTPKKLENITPQRAPIITALSNSVRSMNLNSPSPHPSANISNLIVSEPSFCSGQLELSAASNSMMTRSSGRRRKPVVASIEKENSPVPVEKAARGGKKKGVARRKLCSDSLHPALDNAPDMQDIDFKVPEENDAQKMKRRLRSTYK